MERIIHAAILRPDKVIVFDRDHARCILRSPKPTCKEGSIKGFLTNKMRFVDRQEAAFIAYWARPKQIDKWKQGQCILSEELWCPRSGGKHDYDESLGYVLRGEMK